MLIWTCQSYNKCNHTASLTFHKKYKANASFYLNLIVLNKPRINELILNHYLLLKIEVVRRGYKFKALHNIFFFKFPYFFISSSKKVITIQKRSIDLFLSILMAV